MPSFEVERLSVDPSRSTASAVFVPRVNEPHQPTDDKAAEDIQHHEENTSSPPMHKQQDEHTSFLGSRSPAQPPSPSEAAGDRRGEVLLGWWVEFLALLAGIGAFLAIALILSKYDQHEQPNWRYGLNLNTIIAILSTLLRSSLLAVVAEGKWFIISQLKWSWYRRPKALRNLDHFDAASRGPWGALLLPFEIRRLNLATLGCLVLVLSIAIGSFTQQALKTVPCDRLVPSAESSIQIARQLPTNLSPRIRAGGWDLALEIKMAILDGLGKPTSNESAITVPCSTGNCSFPEFQGVTHTSLGLCRKCVDVSSEIFERIDFALFDGGNGTVVADPNQTAYSFELSNGQSIGPWIWRTGDGNASDAESAQIFLNTSTADFEWQSFASIALSDPEFVEAFGSAVLNFTVLSHTLSDCQVDLGSNSSETKPPLCQHSNLNLDDAFTPNFTTMFNFIDLTAASCAFYPCVKKYHVAVKDGLVEETVKEESLDRIGPVESGNILSDFLHFATPCEVAGLPYTLDNISSAPNSKNFNATLLIDGRNVTVPDNCTYRMTGVFAEALKLFLGDAFQGNCVMPLTSYFRYNSPIALWNTAQCDPWWLKNLFNKGNASFASIDQNMDAVATAATNELRRQGLDWNGLPALITGSTSRTTICNQFDWPWLAFPFALLVATTLLLFAMAIKMWCMGRSGTPGWKSSVLPLLFAADDAVRKNVALWKVSQIEKETDGLIVTLSPGDKGWTFASTRREA